MKRFFAIELYLMIYVDIISYPYYPTTNHSVYRVRLKRALDRQVMLHRIVGFGLGWYMKYLIWKKSKDDPS